MAANVVTSIMGKPILKARVREGRVVRTSTYISSKNLLKEADKGYLVAILLCYACTYHIC